MLKEKYDNKIELLTRLCNSSSCRLACVRSWMRTSYGMLGPFPDSESLNFPELFPSPIRCDRRNATSSSRHRNIGILEELLVP